MHFLKHVASDLYERRLKDAAPKDLLNLRLIFPSRRARLYFSHYISEIAEKPLWLPTTDSIDALFCRISGLRIANRYAVIAEIFRCYKQTLAEMAIERKVENIKGIDESFESFFYWGDLMLHDFDALDKYLIKVDPLLRNVADLKKLTSDDLSFLSPEQIKTLEEFWTHIDANHRLPANFCEFWDTLKPTYDKLHTALKARGEGYTGMIYREAVEKLDAYTFGDERFVFIGFGALSRCEERLFTKLGGISDFYWDYDRYYLDSEIQEAGLFLRHDLAKFRPADADMAADNDVYRQFEQKKNISIIDAPSELMQAKILPMLLREFGDKTEGFPPNTAIALANENMLIPTLYSLGEFGSHQVNITMGYPLAQSATYSLIHFVTALQRNIRGASEAPRFYHKDVLALLNHEHIHTLAGTLADDICRTIVARNMAYVAPEQLAEMIQAHHKPSPQEKEQGERCHIESVVPLFAHFSDYTTFFARLKDLLEAIDEAYKTSTDAADNGTDTTDEASDIDFQRTAIACCLKSLNLLEDALEKCGDVKMSVSMAVNLLLSALKTERIPFEGEPLNGLQIMGILETRLLDFDNLIVLSLNDDTFPGAANMTTLLPYNLRRAYGLPSAEDIEAMSAYSFYRLLQRARNVRLVYNSGRGEQRTGEMSRYLRQLMLESPHRAIIKANSWSASFGALPANRQNENIIEKTDAVRVALEAYLSGKRSLSPSSLKNFMSCPLKFYYSNVLGLQDDAEVEEGADAVMLGNAFHQTMEELYSPFKGVVINRQDIEAMLKDHERLQERIVFHTAKVLINKNDKKLDKMPSATDLRNVRESGEMTLVTAVVLKYVEAMLRYDMKQTPFKLRGLENEVNHEFSFTDVTGITQTVRLHGYIDRIDEKSDTAIIIDYKTGSYANKRNASSFEALFASQASQQRHEIFQTLLYSLIIHQTGVCPDLSIAPALYFLRELSQEQSRGETNISIAGNIIRDARLLLDEFTPHLQALLANIFDFSQPLTMTTDEKHCEHCDFKELCGK